MGVLDRFSPGQRQALMYGGAAVAGFVVVSKLFGKAKTPAAPAASAGTAVPSTDAIGVGQLTDFESQVTDQISTLAMMISQWPGQPAPVSPTPPPPAVFDHPAPPPHPPAPGTDLASSAPQMTFENDASQPWNQGKPTTSEYNSWPLWRQLGFGSQEQYDSAMRVANGG